MRALLNLSIVKYDRPERRPLLKKLTGGGSPKYSHNGTWRPLPKLLNMKARPTKITKMDKLDNYGNTTFVIEFDDGTKGFYTSKNSEQNKFTVGNVADFEVEVKQGSKGPYNKITVPQAAGFKPGGGKPQVDPKQQVATMAMSYTKDCIVAGKVDLKDMEAVFDRMYKAIMSKVI